MNLAVGSTRSRSTINDALIIRPTTATRSGRSHDFENISIVVRDRLSEFDSRARQARILGKSGSKSLTLSLSMRQPHIFGPGIDKPIGIMGTKSALAHTATSKSCLGSDSTNPKNR